MRLLPLPLPARRAGGGRDGHLIEAAAAKARQGTRSDLREVSEQRARIAGRCCPVGNGLRMALTP
jgi:hypothetical protein